MHPAIYEWILEHDPVTVQRWEENRLREGLLPLPSVLEYCRWHGYLPPIPKGTDYRPKQG